MSSAARLALSLAAVIGLCASDLSAWGDHGHEIVARLAARKLTSTTKRRIVTIIRKAADDEIHLKALVGATGSPQPSASDFAQAMALMATWPDKMPGGKGKTGPWHFIDFGLFEGPSTTANRCAEGCVTEMIPTLINNIRASKSIKVTESSGVVRTFGVDKELRFLIHFLGDIHQPLHAVTNADAGGNCEKVTGFTSATGQPLVLNLHSVWDRTILEKTEKASREATVTALLAEFGSDVLAGGVIDPRDQSSESFALAKSDVYPKTKPAAMPVIDHFVEVTPNECDVKAPDVIKNANIVGPTSFDNAAAKKIVRERLYKGGMRLATVLNSLFP